MTMNTVQESLGADALARLHTMELRARTMVEGHFSGQHHSHFKGASVEFADHRNYSRGDDLRRLDWKLFGRTDRYFIKQYDAETNLNVHLLTQKASVTLKKEDIYRAAFLDPLTSVNLTMDETIAMCDDLIAEHGDWLPKFS